MNSRLKVVVLFLRRLIDTKKGLNLKCLIIESESMKFKIKPNFSVVPIMSYFILLLWYLRPIYPEIYFETGFLTLISIYTEFIITKYTCI
jgi:hypothetical protein